MSDNTAPPKEPFKLSMLLYDSRYRGITIQVFVLFLVLSAIFWLANNAATNLAALGKPLRFNFLGETASYDINQRLIEYSSTDSHGRAVLVGLLNTLLVAFMGCVAATVLGVIGGVLRLSSNWLVSRLVAVYVEIFRNIPVLLWIFVCMFTLTAIAPQPRAFRGDNATASMLLNDSVAVTNRGIYIPEPLFSRPLGDINLGIFNVSIELLVLLAVLIGGIMAGRWNNTRANQIQVETGDRPNTSLMNTAFIVVPILVVLIALGFHLGKPELRGFNFQGGINMSAPLIGLWLGLTRVGSGRCWPTCSAVVSGGSATRSTTWPTTRPGCSTPSVSRPPTSPASRWAG